MPLRIFHTPKSELYREDFLKNPLSNYKFEKKTNDWIKDIHVSSYRSYME